MIPEIVTCQSCGTQIQVNSYRKYVKCPGCEGRYPFGGFEYVTIDWKSSKYANVKKWTDCPACRSPNMYLGMSDRKWKCADCGYTLDKQAMKRMVFHFCDECDAFLNIQEGFSAKTGKWSCAACGSTIDVTKENII